MGDMDAISAEATEIVGKEALQERRYRIVMLTESNIMGIIDGSVRVTGLPQGTRMLRVFPDPLVNAIGIVICHPSFDPVREGEPPPYHIDLGLKVVYHYLED